MQPFVVGTGGKDLYKLGTRKTGSRYFQRSQHGVLALDLRQGSFGWKFHGIDGRGLDKGTPLRVTRSAGQLAHVPGVCPGKVVRSLHDCRKRKRVEQ
jgi:hypothetical protein